MTHPDSHATHVVVRDVGPRDGLQPERPVCVDQRVALIQGLFAAGIRNIEAVSFVSPKAVPAMADAALVLESLEVPPGAKITALVPNLRGAHDALEHAVDELTVTISASETYNQHNVRRSIHESMGEVEAICLIADDANVPVDVVVSCAFGSPFEGDIGAESIAKMGEQLRALGGHAITYADTTGMATPKRVVHLLDVTGCDVGLHFHQTRGTALVNAWVALGHGVRRFDTSVGGLGGSPFAPGAAGNLATEEFVAILDDSGFSTGIDLPALVEVARTLEDLVGHTVPSTLVHAGTRDVRAGEH